MKELFVMILMLCTYCHGYISFRDISDDKSKSRSETVEEDIDLKDAIHGVKMGISNPKCDDGKTNLQIDWDGSPVNYTCFTPKHKLPVNKNLKPSLECDDVPADTMPQHFCMDKKLEYSTPYPTHADHRPLWPQYGEYQFVPPQRWSHNIEHGAIVMLYHPCANSYQTEQLKNIVRSCIYKHIITPTNMIPVDLPLVLVSWGCRLRMNVVDESEVKNFIKIHALHGPEGNYSLDGQYNYKILKQAKVPPGSNKDDKILCPLMKYSNSIM